MKSITPNFFVYNIHETIQYYKQLGFRTTASVPELEPFQWVMMSFESVTFMFQTFESLADELPQINREKSASLLFYIQVEDILSFFERIKDKVHIVKGLEKTFYGATEFSICDLNGYILTFAEDI